MDELIRQLTERRAKLIERRDKLVTAAQDNIACKSDAEKTAYGNAMAEIRRINDGDPADPNAENLKQIDAELSSLTGQRDRDRRAAEIRAQTGDAGADTGQAGGSRAVVTREETTYGEHGKHSYFLDQVRCDLGRGDGDGGVIAARERQQRHEAELRKEMPARIERRRRETERAMDRILSGEEHLNSGSGRERRMARAERRAYERMLGAGVKVFETRAIGTVDGSGGYFVPPLWLVDQYIEFVRAGRVFVNMWRQFGLPSGTNSINIPRIVTGSGTGVQTAEGAPLPARDMQDNFVNALIKTVAGQQDIALQLLDQSPINFDEVVFPDLTADYNMQVDGLAMLGTGTNNQPAGVFSGGTIGSGSGASANGWVVNDAADAWTAQPPTPNLLTGVAKLLSKISTSRMMPPTAFATNPMVWYGLAGTSDANGRPLVVPEQNGQAFNAVANGAGSPATEGPVGHMLGLPWSIDPNWPTTFGGAVAPAMSSVSNGHTAPTPGSGGNPDYTPFFAGVMNDLFIWEGDLRTRTLSEVLSSTLQVRLQLYAYVAMITDRYQDSAGNVVSYGNYNTVGTPASVLSTAGLLSGF